MPSPRFGIRASLFLAILLALAPIARAGQVEVEVAGVEAPRGVVRVALCTEQTFLKLDCPYNAEAPATPGTTLVTFQDVPPGVYAAQVFQDYTEQGVVHRNFLGVPREPIGFSNNANIGLHGPSFRSAAFSVGAGVKRISLRLRRLFGRL
ncbi:MAG TPA: DUF2141 domain-containing protein [Caulobacteraceae bacterium]|nr:DUF2141 domain-containing protein [Caulobacteraceae bacterium]